MKQEMLHFTRLLQELQKIDSEFPLQYALCLSEIAINEGMSLTELADKTGMPLSTVSRVVGALSKHRQRGTAYNLVKVTISPKERRRKQLTLTAKGQSVVKGIAEIIERMKNDSK